MYVYFDQKRVPVETLCALALDENKCDGIAELDEWHIMIDENVPEVAEKVMPEVCHLSSITCIRIMC